jgi:hypothetical protein
MTAFVRSFLILGLVSMATAIAPIARAETVTRDPGGSEILNSTTTDRSQTVEASETVATQDDRDAVLIAEVEVESSEISTEISSPARNRTPLTSRIFPCSSMQQ